ncbi:SDR family NAD(P)-dependent oxidoreductase [Clostridium sp. BL-8]|uniref:SDR family NAD(P)-dependent oxidoreductase n=1 Tax=Clostridium sp. BL-8 TaxID=349938 RepID=UPI00098C9730|nr:SDR family NAD(P)-dependent oxidoreductase [Clostridium sp. BL-8]OOM73403.1 diacetyl reductase [Clostridium sp. BL-8]
MEKLNGKVVIVTGAGRGIGRGVALRLAKEDAHVVVASRSQKTVDEVVQEIHDIGKSAIGVTVDVGIKDQVNAMVEQAVKAFGPVDILVNVAQSWGSPKKHTLSPPETPIEEIEEDEWDYTYQTGFKGTLYGMQAVFQGMKEQHWGRIINFGSPMALSGKPYMAPYNSTKGAITGLSLTAAHEWAKYGITVNCVLPTILTDALKNNHEHELKELVQRLPMGRLGDPEKDAGGLVAFLASDDAAYLTGMSIILDGGAAH